MKTPPRGYLLMEMMLAGAIMAVGLIAAMDHIIAARVSVSMSSKRQTAMSLARAKCDAIVASLPTATADQTTLISIGTSYPGMKWSWSTVDPTNNAMSTPAITATSKEVTCTVEFPTEKKSIEDMAGSASTSDGYGQTTIKQLWFNSPLR
jgi:hypothetical protein